MNSPLIGLRAGICTLLCLSGSLAASVEAVGGTPVPVKLEKHSDGTFALMRE